MMMKRLPLLGMALLLAACAGAPPVQEREPDEGSGREPLLATAGVAHVVVKEAFVTAATPADNIDSPALWVSPAGKALLLATAKKSGRLLAYDGDTGAAQAPIGRKGAGSGEFDRPNGIFVSEDLLFVVERDNHRVQVLRLPDRQVLGSFGEDDLRQPYGIWLRKTGSEAYEVLVSDAYMAGEDAQGNEIPPPLAELGQRIRRYDVRIGAQSLQATRSGDIGATDAAGAIRVPESLWGDPAHDRLLIAEEDQRTGTALREYDMAGRYRGRTVGLGLFKAQAEGIALWQCGDGSGYWISTDQYKDRSLFHVWERASLRHVGAFSGQVVGNTDGVWLHQGATARFPQGVFYAVHDDQAVAAFDWRDIAKALQLAECPRG